MNPLSLQVLLTHSPVLLLSGAGVPPEAGSWIGREGEGVYFLLFMHFRERGEEERERNNMPQLGTEPTT